MKHNRKPWKLFTSFILTLFLLLPCNLFAVEASDSNPEMTVHFLDVGQGLSILAQSENETLLYDGGDPSHADDVVEYLKMQNIDNIDYMISSHYDADHLGGLLECLRSFSVDHVLGADYVHDSDLYVEFVNTATANAIEIEYPKPGDTFSFGSGNFTVVAPSGIHPYNSNQNSVVIRLENGENSFLFTGDAEETSEQDMISTGLNLDCDVLSLGHHGSATSTTWDFLEASSPSFAVISCGAQNKYGHPAQETMQRLSDMQIPVFRTDKQGTLIAVSDGQTLTWNTEPCNDYTPGRTSGSKSADTPKSSEETLDTPSDSSTSVWISQTGQKYHRVPDCGNMNPDKATSLPEADAISRGYGPCSKCF